MTEHITLIRQEISKLSLNLERAKSKPGVRQDEIENIENKLRLKNDILKILMQKQVNSTFAVFWKLPQSEYAPTPEWVQHSAWHRTAGEAVMELLQVKQNPRCAAAKIVMRSEIYEDVTSEMQGNGE